MEGTVTFDGERIDQIPAHEIVKRGLVLCPERRRPFREMTVFDNLMAGAYLQKDKKKNQEDLDKVYDLIPGAQGAGPNKSPGPFPAGNSRCWLSAGP